MMFDIVVHFNRDKLLLQKDITFWRVSENNAEKEIVFLCERPGVLEEILPAFSVLFIP